jgi:hypothetical protein
MLKILVRWQKPIGQRTIGLEFLESYVRNIIVWITLER